MLERLLNDVLDGGAARVQASTTDEEATEALLAMQSDLGALMADHLALMAQRDNFSTEEGIAAAERAMVALDQSTDDSFAKTGVPAAFLEMAKLRARDGFLRRVLVHALAPEGGNA